MRLKIALASLALLTLSFGSAEAKDWSQMNADERLSWGKSFGARYAREHDCAFSKESEAESDSYTVRWGIMLVPQSFVASKVISRCLYAPGRQKRIEFAKTDESKKKLAAEAKENDKPAPAPEPIQPAPVIAVQAPSELSPAQEIRLRWSENPWFESHPFLTPQSAR